MKTLLLPLALAAFLTISSDTLADPMARPTFSFTSAQAPSNYTGGAYNLTVNVESWASSSGDYVFELTSGNAVVSTTTIPIPASASAVTRAVSLPDPAGLPSGCSAKGYVLNVTTPTSGKMSQSIEVMPHCTFASTLTDDWSPHIPDRIDLAKKGTAYLIRPVLEEAPSCQAGPKVKVDVVNETKVSAASLTVQVKAGNTVTSQTAAAFPIAAGATKTVIATSTAGAHDITAAEGQLFINDWSHSLGSNVFTAHTIRIRTTKNCTLAASFTVVRTLAKGP